MINKLMTLFCLFLFSCNSKKIVSLEQSFFKSLELDISYNDVKGVHKQYFQDDNSKIETIFLHTTKEQTPFNGYMIYFYKTGQIKSKTQYINDLPNNEYIRYNKKGEITMSTYMSNGKYDKDFIIIDDNRDTVSFKKYYKGKLIKTIK